MKLISGGGIRLGNVSVSIWVEKDMGDMVMPLWLLN